MRKYLLLLAAAAFIAAPQAAQAGYTANLGPATVSTPDTVGNNGTANVGDGFSITGGTFTGFTPDTAADPQLTGGDLPQYSYDLTNGLATSVVGNVVNYSGNYAINYAGFAGNPVSAGNFNIVATFNGTGGATLNGSLFQTAMSGSPFGDLGAYSSVAFTGDFQAVTFVPGSALNTGLLTNGQIVAAGAPVPEPGSMALLATGLLPLAGVLRRRRK